MLSVADRSRDLDDGPDPGPARPINWDRLSASEAEREWLVLNKWVDWLRSTYNLTDFVVPPYWHRHPALVWELSALHLYWLDAYSGCARDPLNWHREFADSRARLREWVASSGEMSSITWPGESGANTRHDADFVLFVADDVNRRRAAETARHDDGRNPR
ncbi:hypothetical protein F7O44_09155 [Phytoactinopolyspora sp. XMNu-373]|uniref:DUF4913 domain-containing protein n=2 Tax=Phytoactinopolyspora mesophila TaxID=2650750 RepID=A0A7K3M1R0_9ACTN|nr:hypothetical protein [Phytoactinopolyspora mesophila]